MIINKPYIEIRGENTYLISRIKDEVANVEEDIFYAVQNDYGEYLCDEVADAFVVAMLLPALVSGQDITVNAPISEILYYQIANNVVYTLSKVFNKKPIKVYPQNTFNPNYNPFAVATGFSGGVDSFTTVLQHTQDMNEEFKLTHLTLFNVGSYGNDYNKTQKAFTADLKRASKISILLNLPLVAVNSNFCLFYNNSKERIFNFSPRSTICLISGVLSLQKLFRHYFISSTGTIEDIKLCIHDQYYYEWLIASFLSNNCSHIYIANGDLNRVEKTRYIINNNLVIDNLYVCAADIYNTSYGTNFQKNDSPNCSECIKCQRTLITLELLGIIDKYSNRFDLHKYQYQRTKIFVEVLANYKNNHFLNEIHDLMLEINYKVPLIYKIKAVFLVFRNKVAQIKMIRNAYRFFFRKK